MTWLAPLPDRGVIEVTGDDRIGFLQGLVSNDVGHAAPGRAGWAALLTPQGKWLADFFVFADGDRLLLDCERSQLGMIVARLSRFRLRAQVVLRDVSEEISVCAGWDGAAPHGLIAAPDPRLDEAGFRLLAATPPAATASAADWDRRRLELGLPDGSRDLESEKTVLLEAGFDELHGVDWGKGCYMGQELTARTKYRGLIKKRLVPVRVDGALPPSGTSVLRAGSEVGTVRSGRDDRALALLRLDALDGPLHAQQARLRVQIPGWMRLQLPA